jgi:hypothetical protein
MTDSNLTNRQVQALNLRSKIKAKLSELGSSFSTRPAWIASIPGHANQGQSRKVLIKLYNKMLNLVDDALITITIVNRGINVNGISSTVHNVDPLNFYKDDATAKLHYAFALLDRVSAAVNASEAALLKAATPGLALSFRLKQISLASTLMESTFNSNKEFRLCCPSVVVLKYKHNLLKPKKVVKAKVSTQSSDFNAILSYIAKNKPHLLANPDVTHALTALKLAIFKS